MQSPSAVSNLAAQEDFEHLAVALAISQQHGGRGVALLVKTTRTKVNKKERERTGNAERVETAMTAAVDQSVQWAGHTALLLLLQEVSWGKSPVFYVIGELSEADLGIFVLQVKTDTPKIVCWHHGTVTYHQPTRAARWATTGSFPLVLLNPARYYALERPPITGVALFALRSPSRIRFNAALTYGDLNEGQKNLFDLMFLSLCGGLITQKPVKSQDKFLQGPVIGAVIVNRHGQILSYGGDQTALLHGETVAIKSLQGSVGGSPTLDHCRLYTSLEPCAMCSGFIYEACVKRSNDFKVVYYQWDPAVHKSSFGGQEATGITTILEEKNVYETYDKGTATEKLRTKMQEMSHLHQKEPSKLKSLFPKETEDQSGYLNKFENSAVEALRILSFRRRFAKLKLRLLAMPLMISECCKTDPTAEGFLMDIWINIMRFLQVDCGQDIQAEMELVATFLDWSRGRNLLRGPRERPEKRSFLEFYQEYKKVIQVHVLEGL
jgi:tRNA(Arg) A34 adenosine deaminase TadA